jgi:hypothetical protein
MGNENKCALDAMTGMRDSAEGFFAEADAFVERRRGTIPGAFAALADAAEKVKRTSDEIRVERMNLPPMFGTMKQTNKS